MFDKFADGRLSRRILFYEHLVVATAVFMDEWRSPRRSSDTPRSNGEVEIPPPLEWSPLQPWWSGDPPAARVTLAIVVEWRSLPRLSDLQPWWSGDLPAARVTPAAVVKWRSPRRSSDPCSRGGVEISPPLE